MTISLNQIVQHPDGRHGFVSDVRDGGRNVYVTFFGPCADGVVCVTPEEVERWATAAEYAGPRAKAAEWGITWLDRAAGKDG